MALVGMDVTSSGKTVLATGCTEFCVADGLTQAALAGSNGDPYPTFPIQEELTGSCWVMLSTTGALASKEPVFASFPVPCSKKIPYPPRIEVLPSPRGSHAKPTRGAGLNRCPVMQLAGVVPTPQSTKPKSPMTEGSI